MSLGSSSNSGPAFPPGFEHNVPLHAKVAQERKRNKKLEKKRKLKLAASSSTPLSQEKKNDPPSWPIKVADVIDMAKTLGLSFNGPESELKCRIRKILHGQFQDWENHPQ